MVILFHPSKFSSLSRLLLKVSLLLLLFWLIFLFDINPFAPQKLENLDSAFKICYGRVGMIANLKLLGLI